MSPRAADRFPSMQALYDALYGPYQEKPAPIRTKKRALVLLFAILGIILAIAAAILLPPRKTDPVPTPTAPQSAQTTLPTDTAPWMEAVLMADPLAQFGDKDQILSVTFICVDAVPADTTDLSADGSGRIHGWISDGHLTIASAYGVNAAEAAPRLFAGCASLNTVTFGDAFHTEVCASLDEMFLNCTALTRVDAESLDTGSVTSLRRMFSGCTALEQVDVGGWDLSAATDLSGLFADCVSLKTLDVSGWELSNARDISGMFSYCTGLETLDVSSWDVSGARDMMGLFLNCRGLKQLQVENWDTGSVTDMSSLFSFCTGIEILAVENWDTGSVTRMNGMFAGCSGLEALDLSRWNTSAVTDMGAMFLGCPGLQVSGIENWDLKNVTECGGFMDPGCTVGGQDWKELFR